MHQQPSQISKTEQYTVQPSCPQHLDSAQRAITTEFGNSGGLWTESKRCHISWSRKRTHPSRQAVSFSHSLRHSRFRWGLSTLNADGVCFLGVVLQSRHCTFCLPWGSMTSGSALLSSRVQEAGFHSVSMPHLHPVRPPHLKNRSPSQSQTT
jgi:hypothetical protein